MSNFEVIQACASWSGTAVADKVPGNPFENLDVFKAGSSLRNHLMCIVADTCSGVLRYSFNFEVNLLIPNNEDLNHLESSLYRFLP